MTLQVDKNIINILSNLIPEDKDNMLVNIYYSAFYVFDNENIHDRYALVAHEFREIINIIVKEKYDKIQKESLNSTRKDIIYEELKKEGINEKTSIGELLNYEIWKIGKVLRTIRNGLQTLEYKMRVIFKLSKINIPNQKLLNAIKDAYEKFNSIAHHSNEIVDNTRFKELIAIFNDCILAIGRSKTQGLLEIDKILNIKKPSEKDINKIYKIMIFPEQEQHFFKNLNSPEWFIPLKNAGFFNNPPDMEEKDGWFNYPLWSQSIYLEKIYKSYESDVLQIIKNSSNTNNISIIRVYLDILKDIKILPNERKKLFNKWCKYSYNFQLAFSFIDFLNKLIEKDDPAVYDIFNTMLSLKIEDNKQYDLYNYPIEPNLYAGAYEQLFSISIPKLFNKNPEKILEMLCNKLKMILTYETKNKINNPESDQSILWRRTIEDHVQNPGTKYLKGELIEVIGESLKSLINSDPRKFLDLYQSLKSYNFSIFMRLRMFLLLHYKSSELDDEILSFLLDPKYLNHSFYWHEYYLLLQRYLPRLSDKDQNKIIEFIQKNTDDEYEKFKLLHCIQAYLKLNQKEEYIQLKKKYSEPEHPEFNIYVSSFVGPVSPVEKKELSTMSIEEIKIYLKSWEPITGFHQASRIGLARELEQLISNDPKKYVELLINPSELFHTYLLHLLSGLKKAIESDLYNDIQEIIIISRIILDLPPKSELIIKEDRWESCDWSHILLEISDLLFNSVKKDNGVVNKKEYENILQITAELLNNELPIENQYLNYMTIKAGNIRYPHTFKTVAFDTLIEVALKYKNAKEDISVFLDIFIQLFKDQSQLKYFAPVFSRYFYSMMALDEKWGLSIKNKIFPQNYNEIWENAWKGYILHNPRIYTITHDLFRDDYFHALDFLTDDNQWPSYEAGHLRYHIALWMLTGEEDLSENSLVTIFFKKAKNELKDSFIQSIGECAKNNFTDITDSENKKIIIHRCIQFWDWRMSNYKKLISNGQKPQVNELVNFDTLFAFIPFEDFSLLEKMKDTVELTEGKISLVYFEQFFNKLIEHSKKNVDDVLSIVLKVVKNMDTFLFSVKKDYLLSFFNTIKASLETKYDVSKYNEVIDILVSLKQIYFKELYITEN